MGKRNFWLFIKRSNESIRYVFIIGLLKQRYCLFKYISKIHEGSYFHAMRANNDNSDVL